MENVTVSMDTIVKGFVNPAQLNALLVKVLTQTSVSPAHPHKYFWMGSVNVRKKIILTQELEYVRCAVPIA